MIILEIQITLKGLTHLEVKKNLQEILLDIDFLKDQPLEVYSELKSHRMGLQYLSIDYLYQSFLYLMGMLYHHLSELGSEQDLFTAK
jgi:hypothetical protein